MISVVKVKGRDPSSSTMLGILDGEPFHDSSIMILVLGGGQVPHLLTMALFRKLLSNSRPWKDCTTSFPLYSPSFAYQNFHRDLSSLGMTGTLPHSIALMPSLQRLYPLSILPLPRMCSGLGIGFCLTMLSVGSSQISL